MRAETASLLEAIEEYLADVRHRLKPSTWRIYRHNLLAYSRSFGGGQLRDLTPPKVKAYVNRCLDDGKVHAAHNKMIDLKALAMYLAKKKIFTEGGWHSMQQRLRRTLDRNGIAGYKQHRNRNTWTRDAVEAGVPETAIVQMGGPGRVDMLRRYHGKLTTTELKRSPRRSRSTAKPETVVKDDK